MLTSKVIDAAKPKNRQYKLADAKGLYILVRPTNAKMWRIDYQENGKRKTKTLGRYPEIGVAKARLLNVEFKEYLDGGNVPIDTYTFDEAKHDWLISRLPTYKNFKHKQQIQYRLDEFVSPVIGNIDLKAIKRTHLVELVKKVQSTKNNGDNITETAHRVALLIRQVMDYAVDCGKIETHPAFGLTRVLNTPLVKNMPCVAVCDAPKLLQAINNSEMTVAKLGLLFCAYTFVRSAELRFMQWSEIKDKTFWVIPKERMKMGKLHVVPLSKSACAILKQLEMINGDSKYVFLTPHKGNKPISENTMLDKLYALAYKGKMCVHGFRSLASTVLNEQSPFAHDVIERQLAHKETDAVRAAYNRAEYLPERIKLMDWWADWVDSAISADLTRQD